VQAALAAITDGATQLDEASGSVTVPVAKGGESALIDALTALRAAGVQVHDIALRQPDLDEVFLALTGAGATEGD
jgi:ABC-2 type transport system ATP-binding protein